jgi:hypothetical protein
LGLSLPNYNYELDVGAKMNILCRFKRHKYKYVKTKG